MKPKARLDLITRSIADEVVVYDPTTHAAHCLNRIAALVFGGADGTTSVPDLAARASAATGARVSEGVVWDALERLAEANLLEAPVPSRSRPSRRQMLRQVGLGAATLAPVVASLIVPTPAEAANTCIQAAACTTANAGQPCYVSAQSECLSMKICTGVNGQCQ